MTDQLKQAAQQAQLVLQEHIRNNYESVAQELIDVEFTLRAAIEQALTPGEPVAWMLECQTHTGDTAWKLSWSRSGAGVCNRLQGQWHEKPLYEAPQPHPQKRPQNCGTGFCSCIECPYSDHFADAGKPMEPDHFPDARKMMEPFGFFRSTMDGWEDCAETDEGARPLYEGPRYMPTENEGSEP